tara:strand:- start:734 stop:931 length:198 start_codon:yes stop_codon:yes gene_type:complete
MKKDTQFHKELKELLKKFDAEIMIEDFGRGWGEDNNIVVDFNWDIDKEKESTPQLVIGTWENGDA